MSEVNEELENNEGTEENSEQGNSKTKVIPVSELYKGWFLDYASYVILERAVPSIEDGFKPVQRRILHAMKELDDGRYNKVANIIGTTMQYHPHGDASIGDAAVNLGQKELLIDTQGNWGDIRTGDRSAAPRYIEARLSKFALDVAFNSDTTIWQKSYDGRKKEPVNLPVKFPMILVQGVEGIAVGLSTKILPHNFIELVKGSIAILKGKRVELMPDFITGGMADFSDYNEGRRGGRVRVRAKMEIADKSTIKIIDVPYGVTTSTLVDSIIRANEKGKIKIKKVIDNTAKNVEIEISLPAGVSPDQTVDALYAFSECEVSISPNACVIVNNKPQFMSVNELLRISTDKTTDLLRQELKIKEADLKEKIFFTSLLKIFIDEGMYKHPDYENSGNVEKCYEVLDVLYKPFFHIFYRKIEQEDYKKLIEKPLSSITRFDTSKVDEQIKNLEDQIKEVQHQLENIVDYAIAYWERILEKYGKGRERKTEIMAFDIIEAKQVAVTNEKLYVNREEGFIGMGMKKDEFVCDCSDIADVITIRADGVMQVSRIADKVFVGKNIIHVAVWKKGDDHMVYNLAYLDGGSGATFVKRFSITSITRDKEYDLGTGAKGSKVLYLTANPNSESEVIGVQLSQGAKARVKVFDYDLAQLAIKGRSSKGNTLTKYPVRKIIQKSVGSSTLGGRDLWLDEAVGKFNTAERGKYLGSFDAEEHILVIYNDGNYELMDFDLNKRVDVKNIEIIQKLTKNTIVTAVHYDGGHKDFYVKRFQIETNTTGKMYSFISEEPGSKLTAVSIDKLPVIEYTFRKEGAKDRQTKKEELAQFIDVKGWKSLGNKLSPHKVFKVEMLESIKQEENDVEEMDITIKEAIESKMQFKPKIKDEIDENEKGIKPGTTIDLDINPKKSEDNGEQLGLF